MSTDNRFGLLHYERPDGWCRRPFIIDAGGGRRMTDDSKPIELTFTFAGDEPDEDAAREARVAELTPHRNRTARRLVGEICADLEGLEDTLRDMTDRQHRDMVEAYRVIGTHRVELSDRVAALERQVAALEAGLRAAGMHSVAERMRPRRASALLPVGTEVCIESRGSKYHGRRGVVVAALNGDHRRVWIHGLPKVGAHPYHINDLSHDGPASSVGHLA